MVEHQTSSHAHRRPRTSVLSRFSVIVVGVSEVCVGLSVEGGESERRCSLARSGALCPWLRLCGHEAWTLDAHACPNGTRLLGAHQIRGSVLRASKVPALHFA